MKNRTLDPTLVSLIREIAPHVVVIGSVARGEDDPKDLDLFHDLDDDKARGKIAQAIKRLGIEFEAWLPGHWAIPAGEGDVPIDILPLHRGPDFKECVKGSRRVTLFDVELRVAEASKARGEDEG